MIKKWNIFIKESVDYKSIKDEIDKITNDKFGLPDTEKRRQLISIFENDLRLGNDNLIYKNHITKVLNIYTDYIYNDKSKEIKRFLEDTFITSDQWLDINHYTKILFKKSIKEISEIILKTLDLYNSIEDEIEETGQPKRTKLSLNLEQISINSLDEDTLEFFDVVERYSQVYLELGYDKEGLNVELLQKITDEVVSLSSRVEDATGLKNTFVEFGDNLLVGFEF
jgi:hypothetical protein